MSNKDNSSANRERAIERRRQRAAGAFHLASALVRTYGESHPDISKVSFHAVRLADAILDRLEETEKE